MNLPSKMVGAFIVAEVMRVNLITFIRLQATCMQGKWVQCHQRKNFIPSKWPRIAFQSKNKNILSIHSPNQITASFCQVSILVVFWLDHVLFGYLRGHNATTLLLYFRLPYNTFDFRYQVRYDIEVYAKKLMETAYLTKMRGSLRCDLC